MVPVFSLGASTCCFCFVFCFPANVSLSFFSLGAWSSNSIIHPSCYEKSVFRAWWISPSVVSVCPHSQRQWSYSVTSHWHRRRVCARDLTWYKMTWSTRTQNTGSNGPEPWQVHPFNDHCSPVLDSKQKHLYPVWNTARAVSSVVVRMWNICGFPNSRFIFVILYSFNMVKDVRATYF